MAIWGRRPDGESESRRSIGFSGLCPLTNPLQLLLGRISTGSFLAELPTTRESS